MRGAHISQFRVFWSHGANDGTYPDVSWAGGTRRARMNGNDLADRDHCLVTPGFGFP
jgi:hypothetical protein